MCVHSFNLSRLRLLLASARHTTSYAKGQTGGPPASRERTAFHAVPTSGFTPSENQIKRKVSSPFHASSRSRAPPLTTVDTPHVDAPRIRQQRSR